jgi:hypothetical protein
MKIKKNGKVITLTESDLIRIVKKLMVEQNNNGLTTLTKIEDDIKTNPESVNKGLLSPSSGLMITSDNGWKVYEKGNIKGITRSFVGKHSGSSLNLGDVNTSIQISSQNNETISISIQMKGKSKNITLGNEVKTLNELNKSILEKLSSDEKQMFGFDTPKLSKNSK